MSAQPEQSPRETRWVDPRTLITRANVRAQADPDPELVESIRANGIISPPVVYADGDDLVLVAGHRRTAAAIAAELDRIEVTVGPRLDEQDRIAAQVTENTNRAGLRAVETAAAVEQMTLLGVPAGQIARAAGLRRAQVEAARAVAGANTAVKHAIIEAPELTLDQAATLTSWGEDPDAVADLLAAAEDGEVAFAHTQARLTDARERAEQLAATVKQWQSKGYQVLNPDGRYINLPPGAAFVHDLVDANGKEVGAGYYGVGQALADSPDRAVLVSAYRTESVQEVCLNPKANGLRKAPSPYARSGPTQTRDERAEVIANNKLWKVATGVRQAHLGSFIRAGKFTPALVDALHRHLVAHPEHLGEPWKRKLFFGLLDFPGSGVTKSETTYGRLETTFDAAVPANRVTGQLLAAVAEVTERSLEGSTWRSPNQACTEWLDLLIVHTGYQLSDVEVLAMKATDPKWTAPTASTPGKRPAKGHERRRPPAAGRAGAAATASRRTATPPSSPATAPAAAKKPPATGRAR